MTDILSQSVTIWLPLLTGIITIMVTLYGLYRNRMERQRQRQEVLSQLAVTAVRITGSAYVRPLLKLRLMALVEDASNRRLPTEDYTLWRMAMFCKLQLQVRLTDEEKHQARERSYTYLLETLRRMPDPPLDISSVKKKAMHQGKMYREIEKAYNLSPQQSNSLIMDLGAFVGRC